MSTVIYLIGALKNEQIPLIGNILRSEGYEVFEDWIAPGPDADKYLLAYEKLKGSSYKEALASHAAQHVFHFDKTHIDRADIGVLVMPAGKSGHLELGYMAGKGKRTYVLFDAEPERFDLMYNFADDVFFDLKDLIVELDINPVVKPEEWSPTPILTGQGQLHRRGRLNVPPTPDEVMRRVPEVQNRLADVIDEENIRFWQAGNAGTTNNG